MCRPIGIHAQVSPPTGVGSETISKKRLKGLWLLFSLLLCAGGGRFSLGLADEPYRSRHAIFFACCYVLVVQSAF
jgi:hypothetical protein